MAQATRARVFMSGRSQHVTIPKEFRFKSSVVSIRRDPESGNVIISEVASVDDVFAALDAARVPEDFLLTKADRNHRPPEDRPVLNDLFDDESNAEEQQ